MTEKAPCGACDACEHCPFPDCTWDGVTRAEWDAAKAEDASARHFGESKLAAQQRAQYQWGMAMYLAGLSPRTINRVIDLLPAVADKYRDLKPDQLADEFFRLTLADRGVNLPETERKQ